jgi:diguanylate cyclase (GGDEF)-like protein
MNPHDVAAAIAKLALDFEELAKSAPELRAAMQHLNQKAKAGEIDPKHLDAIRRGLFTDTMTGGKVGNKAAYEDFERGQAENPQEGIHIRLDANDFGSVNKLHGFEEGDKGIRSIFGSLRESADEVDRKNSKIFRIGGDEGHIFIKGPHATSHQTAAQVQRALHDKLNALSPMGGTHKHSVSMGFGATAEQAEQALLLAKKAKTEMRYPVGQAEHHTHSLVPGFEGAIPTGTKLTQIPIAPKL